MEPTRAKEILRALADGRDPATGKPFPPNGPYQQADIVRALHMALAAMEKGGKTTVGLPRRSADRAKEDANWTPEADKQLRHSFASKKPIPEIALAHGRTPGAITARLASLGLIADTATNRAGRGHAPS